MSTETEACTHCWHNMGSWTDASGTHKSERCCHCGGFRTVAPPKPVFPSGGKAYAAPQHGPFAPTIARWG